MRTETPSSEPQLHGGVFATTHWSVVLAAGQRGTPESGAALELLCRTYWYPLYAFVRRQGYSPQDSEDLLVGFFTRFLEKDYLKDVDPAKGRFRSFLLAALKHYLANEWDKAKAVRRGGRIDFLPLDAEAAETRYYEEPATELTPEKLYEQRWACVLLERVMARLEHDFQEDSRSGPNFDMLKSFLLGEDGCAPYGELATRLGLSEAALKMRVQRLRRRYQRLLREEIAQTVGQPDQVEDEIRHLFSVVGG